MQLIKQQRTNDRKKSTNYRLNGLTQGPARKLAKACMLFITTEGGGGMGGEVG